MTSCGFLPPSSSSTFLSCSPAVRATSRPTWVDPVNEIMSMSGCRVSLLPTPLALVRTLTTPSGRPASSSSWVRWTVVPEVSSLGLTTAVQPTASANGSFWLMISSGKFQGVIIATTPTGSFTTMASTSAPSMLCASP